MFSERLSSSQRFHYQLQSYCPAGPHGNFRVPPDVHQYCSHVPQSADSAPSCSSTHLERTSVVVVGGLYFLGARLVSHLVSTGRDVQALASYESVLHDKELVWYRDQQLRTHHGITVEIANLSNSTQVTSVLRGHAFSEIVFVPPGVDGELAESGGKDNVLSDAMGKSLEGLVSVLEVLKEITPCTKIVLLSLSRTDRSEVTSAWTKTLELLIATYHKNYHIPMSILRLSSSMHGPWGTAALNIHNLITAESARFSAIAGDYCWYIRDVVRLVSEVIKQPESCLILELEECLGKNDPTKPNSEVNPISKKEIGDLEKSLKWAVAYESNIRHSTARTSHEVVFTSYFTSTADFQRKFQHSPNQFQYMAEFFRSLKKLSLKAVIFHDGLDPGFQHRAASHYPKVSFSKVDSLHHRSTNDARFYAYFRYLRDHPEIDKVLLSDVSDVVFQKNPFELMSVLGSWLYVGKDIDIFPSMRTMPWIEEGLRGCFGNYSMDNGELSRLLRMDTVYNAGIIGGSREVVLDLLAVMVAYLDTTPASLNCNMPTLNYAVHRHFFGKVFTGFPLTSRFLRYQTSPKGVYVVHK